MIEKILSQIMEEEDDDSIQLVMLDKFGKDSITAKDQTIRSVATISRAMKVSRTGMNKMIDWGILADSTPPQHHVHSFTQLGALGVQSLANIMLSLTVLISYAFLFLLIYILLPPLTINQLTGFGAFGLQ